ncbi:MAG TPA: aspartyl protease family protein [Bacteroidia bacterium]|nr:aspartyl protease family protein [Bacteroidia bacterium]HNS12041.1 aspartyl protease family protein [Bacteroidia bacterium]
MPRKKTVVVPIQILDIEEDGFHLLIEAKIGGKVALLLIDSGASRTVFDINRIKVFTADQWFEPHDKLSTGLGTNTMVTHTTELSDLEIGELSLPGFKAVLLDLGHVNESYLKLNLHPIDGVLGSDVLLKYKAVIDYGRRELLLEASNR